MLPAGMVVTSVFWSRGKENCEFQANMIYRVINMAVIYI